MCARKASGACPVDLKVSKSQTTHALFLLFSGFFSDSRVSGNHVAHSRPDPTDAREKKKVSLFEIWRVYLPT